jgi:hypothetical protein
MGEHGIYQPEDLAVVEGIHRFVCAELDILPQSPTAESAAAEILCLFGSGVRDPDEILRSMLRLAA